MTLFDFKNCRVFRVHQSLMSFSNLDSTVSFQLDGFYFLFAHQGFDNISFMVFQLIEEKLTENIYRAISLENNSNHISSVAH